MSRWQVTGLPGYKTQSAVENFYIFGSATNKTQSMSFRNIKFLEKKKVVYYEKTIARKYTTRIRMKQRVTGD